LVSIFYKWSGKGESPLIVQKSAISGPRRFASQNPLIRHSWMRSPSVSRTSWPPERTSMGDLESCLNRPKNARARFRQLPISHLEPRRGQIRSPVPRARSRPIPRFQLHPGAVKTGQFQAQIQRHYGFSPIPCNCNGFKKTILMLSPPSGIIRPSVRISDKKSKKDENPLII
jgi:hypothetical protein